MDLSITVGETPVTEVSRVVSEIRGVWNEILKKMNFWSDDKKNWERCAGLTSTLREGQGPLPWYQF